MGAPIKQDCASFLPTNITVNKEGGPLYKIGKGTRENYHITKNYNNPHKPSKSRCFNSIDQYRKSYNSFGKRLAPFKIKIRGYTE